MVNTQGNKAAQLSMGRQTDLFKKLFVVLDTGGMLTGESGVNSIIWDSYWAVDREEVVARVAQELASREISVRYGLSNLTILETRPIDLTI